VTTQDTRIPEWTMGEKFRKARREAGIGIDEMAKQLGVSKQAVSHWEMDRTKPKELLAVVRRWAQITGVDEAWLFGLVTSREPQRTQIEPPKRRGRRKRGRDRRRPLGTPDVVVMGDASPAEAA
jgi:transcriptional regulator with XRE-family HTH domain